MNNSHETSHERLENIKDEIKQSWKSILGIGIFVSLMSLWMNYEFTEGMYSANGQYQYMIDMYKSEMKCEIINAVPENYYSGKISLAKISDSFMWDIPFTFGVNLSDEQVKEIQQFQIEQFKTLPCYDEWLERQNLTSNEPLERNVKEDSP